MSAETPLRLEIRPATLTPGWAAKMAVVPRKRGIFQFIGLLVPCACESWPMQPL